MAVHYSGCQYRLWYEFCYVSMKQIHNLPNSSLLHVSTSMFSCEGFILMHLPSLLVLCSHIRIIRCIQTSGSLTDSHVHALARFMFPSLSCLYRSQLVLLVSSAALSTTKIGKKKSPLLWLIKHEHPVVLSLPSMPSSTLSSVRFPSNPISNSPCQDRLMKVMQMCSVCNAIFLHPSTSCLVNTPKQWRCAGLDSKWDSCKEYVPITFTEWYLVWFSDLDVTREVLVWSSLIDVTVNCEH